MQEQKEIVTVLLKMVKENIGVFIPEQRIKHEGWCKIVSLYGESRVLDCYRQMCRDGIVEFNPALMRYVITKWGKEQQK